MDNGTIWGHGALLGPDFSAEYLHTLALHDATRIGRSTIAAVCRISEQFVIPALAE
jgi:nitric oxide reductase large subunit